MEFEPGVDLFICKPGGLCWHSRMPTECPIWKINSVSHLSRASLTLIFTDVGLQGLGLYVGLREAPRLQGVPRSITHSLCF